MLLKNKTVVLGITGGIAAYKMPNVAHALVKLGADVHVLMTKNATEFISPLVFETLTRRRCQVDTFDRNFQYDVAHISLANAADLMLIAPATANVIAKLAHGQADDMLTTVTLAATCPKLVAPAMNTHMLENPITQDNLKTLEHYGFTVIPSGSGMLACGDVGSGRIVLAMFHTCFNVCNTGVLIWFIPQLEKVVCKLIKPKADKEDEDFRLRFIQAGIMKTPELSVFEAQQEIGSFGERIHRMFSMVRELMDTQDAKTFDKLYERIEKYEGISDNMEIEIAKYLDQVSDAHLSDDTKAKIRSMLRAISEIESIGDSCYNLARTIKRKGENKEEFTAKQNENIHQMFKLVDESLTQMNFMFAHDRQSINMNHTYNIETEINNFRTQLRNQNLDDVDNHLYTYGVGTLYMDIIQECEKLGDYVVNVAEARMGTRASA